MMPATRIGVDFVGLTGVTTLGSPDVFINSIPATLFGSPVTPHEPCCCGPGCGCQEHCASVIVSGSSTVFINNIPSVYLGSLASCGHPVTTGSPDVFFG